MILFIISSEIDLKNYRNRQNYRRKWRGEKGREEKEEKRRGEEGKKLIFREEKRGEGIGGEREGGEEKE
jgi:hypothetical protein